jgi:superfamily II DNA or RNA helicase
MVTFTVENRYTSLTGDVPHDMLDDTLSFAREGAEFARSYRNKYWDGRKHLYNKLNGRLPTGLCSIALALLKANNVPYEIIDIRISENFWGIPINLNGVTLREYQLQAIDRAVRCERGVLHMATNAGKTEVAAGIIQRIGLPTIFISHTRALMNDTADRLCLRLGQPIGTIGGGKWQPSDVTCCVVNTLEQRLRRPETKRLLDNTPVIISDECHRVGDNKWYKVLMACNARYRYGMSGTPFDRTDGNSLMLCAATGGTIYSITNSDLVQGGYSSEATIHLFAVRQPDTIWTDLTWRDAYKLGIVRNAWRNTLIADVAAFPTTFGMRTGKVLIYVREIQHGHILHNMIARRGARVDYAHGGQPLELQLEKLNAFRADLPVLVISGIGDEGLDLPDVRVGINAAGGKSRIKTLQKLGRGLRRDERIGKVHLDWVDFIDFHNDYLLQHSQQRLADYEQQQAFEIKRGAQP